MSSKPTATTSEEVPFGDEPDGLPTGATVLEYAIWANPDEDWQVCCICGCAGDCASYDRLYRALLLMADGTLARSAWCFRLRCNDDKSASTKLAWEGPTT